MTLAVALVPNGQHHAVVTGNVTIGADFGEVPALGAAQLLRLRLPFNTKITAAPGFEAQFYIFARSLDGFVTNVVLDAIPFTYDTTSAVLRLNVDVAAVPAAMVIELEAHHTIGR